MHIHNTTFACEPQVAPDLEIWLRESLIPRLHCDHAAAPRLCQLVDAPGADDFAQQAASFSLQFEFTDLTLLHQWHTKVFEPALQLLFSRFGEGVIPFESILKIIC